MLMDTLSKKNEDDTANIKKKDTKKLKIKKETKNPLKNPKWSWEAKCIFLRRKAGGHGDVFC